MGMAIDEAIKGVEKRILPIFDNDADHKALDMAIETMRKYQKIAEIVKAWNDNNSFDSMIQINEVIENGNDD